MSNGGWQLEPNAEREILLPWLQAEPDPETKELVLRYLADLLIDPWRPGLEDGDSGVFSVAHVPHTNAGLTWTMDVPGRQIVLAHVG